MDTSHPGWRSASLTPLRDMSQGLAAKAALTVVKNFRGEGLDNDGPEIGAALELLGLLPYEPGKRAKADAAQSPVIKYNRPGQR